MAAFANQIRQEVDAMPMFLLENVSETIAAVTDLLMSTHTGVLSDGIEFYYGTRKSVTHECILLLPG